MWVWATLVWVCLLCPGGRFPQGHSSRALPVSPVPLALWPGGERCLSGEHSVWKGKEETLLCLAPGFLAGDDTMWVPHRAPSPPQGPTGSGKVTLSQAWPSKVDGPPGCSWEQSGEFRASTAHGEGLGREGGPGFQELTLWRGSELVHSFPPPPQTWRPLPLCGPASGSPAPQAADLLTSGSSFRPGKRGGGRVTSGKTRSRKCSFRDWAPDWEGVWVP